MPYQIASILLFFKTPKIRQKKSTKEELGEEQVKKKSPQDIEKTEYIDPPRTPPSQMISKPTSPPGGPRQAVRPRTKELSFSDHIEEFSDIPFRDGK
jgi:hypothetical protein